MEELGYIRLGELIPGTKFTVDELKLTNGRFKKKSSKKWVIVSKWINYADPSDKNLILCAPFIGGQFQTSKNLISFLSIDEMVTVNENKQKQ